MSSAPLDTISSNTRNAGIDALRSGTTLLVVVHHTAITYGAIGGWYYKEVQPDDSLSSLLLVFFCTFNQAWFMGLFFLLAGYYTPGSLQTKGSLRYLWDRLRRLGIPLVVYGCLIGPATIALAQTTHGKPFIGTLLWLWRHGQFEKGPLWFAWALLIFSCGVVAWRALTAPRIKFGATRSFPTNSAMLAAALVTGVAAFTIRLLLPVGKELWGLQLGFFASYVVLFITGYLAASPHWLERWPRAQVRTWRQVAWIALPTLPIVAVLGSRYLGIEGRPEGGWNMPAVVYAFWEPLVAWGVILGLLRWCQTRFTELGSIGSRLARRSFAIYAIHPPVVVAVTVAWRGVAAPALLKFSISAAVACVMCYLLAGLLLRVPSVSRVL